MTEFQDSFRAEYTFELDPFQLESLDIIEAGSNVLVGAPTGAGKTVVGDAAIFYWRNNTSENVKIYYTTPIKALSNQKFHELQDKYGKESVGLVTGDISINHDAPIVVMTTEVLRNQIYGSAPVLRDLRCVILDEVHYLGDKIRGSVWEEVLIHLDPSVQIIALSATVSNIEEFGDWLESVRGNCHVVLTENRPIPLQQFMVLSENSKIDGISREGAKLYPLWHSVKSGSGTSQSINKDLEHKMRTPISGGFKGGNRNRYQRRGGNSKGRSFPNGAKGGGVNGRSIPKRSAIIRALKDTDILPCIYFIFSRQGCDDAVKQVLQSKIQLTTDEQRDEISFIVDMEIHTRADFDDLHHLGFDKWREALMSGVAAHHAGLLPIFKEITEKLFERGLIKVVFATETLALGINMPARSVVIEKLTKYDGVNHVRLTPGQFTQLTGRAGRRGLDTVGYAVVVDGRNLTPRSVASLASNRVYPLISSFTPSYNLAANLVATSDNQHAIEVLTKSFAQFQFNRKHPNSKSTILVDKYYHLLDVLEHFEYIARRTSYHSCDPSCHSCEGRNPTTNEYILTNKGNTVRNFYLENELIFCEAITSGLFEKLSARELIALLSVFVSVSRVSTTNKLALGDLPIRNDAPLISTLKSVNSIYMDVKRVESFNYVYPNSEEEGLNFGLIEVLWQYVNPNSTAPFMKLLDDFSLGDIVRAVRGVMDILSQMVRYSDDNLQIKARVAYELMADGPLAVYLE